ncbi:MAG: restriction endonuclease subunit R [Microcoleus sp. PH2017_25_DOB_D_A]|uniref:restriction endonuclease subunit R n=1 Tax=unclassified Microcoleus TaxID=2642155 RepID=UPI001D9E2C53|nr:MULTISPECIES: restriction endonuclease subunit R [unclassified Microcoleus]TAE06541.1 MAG: restriction endonuclease subunit R [Oscillatoriales cyanobacterium]MCC3474622.1 restriction endonuclease subunit R [Microcoleus sp. PH2017_13_LAR_U_A]MCC3487122.1 restriction endonuclease subunit R [Microcoleus sp. PH2017_14_LAR_D_A]MCC3492791.1 restriction endonuclease subunit R [Microcoleus sp. PH2017_16_JOR_D_A]MCC3499018.1 restriction endonuclease subunit R [Microcoleus sp. PH2017_15_JOR_U_A]
MTQNLEASQLSLNDVRRLLKLERQTEGSFTDFFSLEPLTDFEQQELLQISNDFWRYLEVGKVSEELVKFLSLSPLMRLTGFFKVPVVLTMEDSIPIEVEDGDTLIKGRLDILAVNQPDAELAATQFWILVVEAKNSAIAPLAGLPQLLTYTYKSLQQQSSVWGLTTNGESYRFVRVTRGNPCTYQILPELNLIDRERSLLLAQVLKAICKLQNVQLQLA